MKSPFYNPSYARILYCCGNSLFVVNLLVDFMFIHMGSVSNDHLDFVFGRKEFSKLHFYHQSNHLSHWTVGNRRSEMHRNFLTWADDITSFEIHNIQLFESQRILWIVYVSNQFKHLKLVDWIFNILIKSVSMSGPLLFSW